MATKIRVHNETERMNVAVFGFFPHEIETVNETEATTEKETTTMTLKERREARTYSTIGIRMDTDKLREEVDEMFETIDAIKNAVSDRAAKMRITRIEKIFVGFEDALNRMGSRIEKNGGIFPEFEGIKLDFETVKKTVAMEKSYL